MSRVAGRIGLLGLIFMAGCGLAAPSDEVLRERATQFIRAGARFPDNPAVRAQAMEALVHVLPEQAGLLLREGLKDEHPGVRFAACMGLGERADQNARSAVQPLANDPDPSVRVAAWFALERMGDFSHRKAWRDVLFSDPKPEVRRNAVLALGRLDNRNVVPLLARASTSDDDEGVRLQALEAMALLGDAYATTRFIHDAYGGLGFKQPFALLTLGRVKTEQARAALRTRLNSAPYIEARLAAARGLGMQGSAEGYDLALRSLNWNEPKRDLPDDPPNLQVMRVRSMAALALGAIGSRDARGALNQTMERPDDPRVQVA
ncbi:MAG TPA: HEAT repeat domain-containing protein, partial [Phycisphaerae bacterium]|nr:HEAT repeat domain-containing protein [Phycisphaerae bacterium]